jgi:hypothetical protein
MIVKYIIKMTHHKVLGEDLLYYYSGQNKVGVTQYDTRTEKAKKYLWKEEAYRDMSILKAVHTCKSDTFEVVQISCRK